ncbi:hypothetical protein, partial [Bradyrhizobium liaoningense]|uniref:hypothetical protein n=1 Tax=Bradyrhizobium liaoningense TaxID=43992 RepID=UPI001BA8CFE0
SGRSPKLSRPKRSLKSPLSRVLHGRLFSNSASLATVISGELDKPWYSALQPMLYHSLTFVELSTGQVVCNSDVEVRSLN